MTSSECVLARYRRLLIRVFYFLVISISSKCLLLNCNFIVFRNNVLLLIPYILFLCFAIFLLAYFPSTLHREEESELLLDYCAISAKQILSNVIEKDSRSPARTNSA